MADTKISALTSATTLDGTEVVPIVQSSTTKKIAVSSLLPGHPGYTSGRIYGSNRTLSTGSGFATNTQYYIPIVVPKPLTISALLMEVTAGTGSSTALMGLYDCVSSQPSTLLTAASPTAVDTSSAAVKTSTLASSLAVSPGIYFAGILLQFASVPTFRVIGSTDPLATFLLGATSGTNAVSTAFLQGFRQANATGSLVASASSLTEQIGATLNVAYTAA